MIEIRVDKSITIHAVLLKSPFIAYLKFGETTLSLSNERISESVMMIKAVTRQYLSSIEYKSVGHVNKCSEVFENTVRFVAYNPDFQQKILWEGTDLELLVWCYTAEGSLIIEKNIFAGRDQIRTVIDNIIIEDYSKLELIPDESLAIFPNFHIQLKLSYQSGKIIHPLRDIVFDQFLPESYYGYAKLLEAK